MSNSQCSLYRCIRKVPFLGPIIDIANSYAYRGDANCYSTFAPTKLWLKAFLPEFLISATLTAICLGEPVFFDATAQYTPSGFKPEDLVLTILPNVLGFGIGVFALLFCFNSDLLYRLHTTIKNGRQPGSILMLVSALSFPLIVIILTIALAIVSETLPSVPELKYSTGFLMWYSFLLVLEMIHTVFLLAEQDFLTKIKSSEDITKNP